MELLNVQETDYTALYDKELLYKYVDCSDILKKRIITDLEIYFTDPEEFGNDENHCFNIEYDKVTDEQLRIRAKEILHSDNKGRQLLNEESLLNQMVQNYRKYVKEWSLLDKEERRRGLGICSLSINKDIPDMWSMFANDFKGICVGLNAAELFKQSKASGGGLVNYFSKTPDLPPPFFSDESDIVSLFIETLSLPTYFKSEAEYRLFKMYVYGTALRQQTIDSSVYREVIIGDAMPTNERNDLFKILKDKLPDINIYFAKYNIDLRKVEIYKN